MENVTSNIGIGVCILVLFMLLGCNSKTDQPLQKVIRGQISHTLNPSGRAPLTASLSFFTKKPCQVNVSVPGMQPLTKSFADYKSDHTIPLIGLYPDTTNLIEITLVDEGGHSYNGQHLIKTEPLPPFFPSIEIISIDTLKMERGFHLMEVLIPNNGKFDSYTIVFDNQGAIRWFLDMSDTRRLAFSTLRMKNGNSMHVSWIDAFELDDLGNTIQQWQLGGYAGDHDIKELPDGNLLMGASKRETTIELNGQTVKTRYDAVVELDRKTMNAIKEWDMRSILDVDRTLLNENLGRDDYFDWFHVNSVAYSPMDDCILVSGRNQGVIKVDQQNKLKWILAPHKGWDRSGPEGKGPATKPFLLTAVDPSGNPYPSSIQEGLQSHESFEWPSGQHSIKILENGNILVFDNGFARGFVRNPQYSRAVEYQIDEEQKTIHQVWQYGKEEGLELFSAITSDVDILPRTNNRLITSGYIRLSSDAPHAKMIEITYPENEVVFEARAYFKNVAAETENAWAKFDVVYRGERYQLIPPEQEVAKE